MRRLILILFILLPLNLLAAPPVAIKNIDPKISHMTREEAYAIYSLRTRYWVDGTRIKVFMLDPDSSSIHISFIKDTLGMNPGTFKQDIVSYSNLGLGYYKIVSSEYEMLRMISKTPGSVGYVSERMLIINSGDSFIRQVSITE